MNEVRSYASLSSGLLARKGSAKPAMRPQGYSGFEDLGWNDMGYAPGSSQPVPEEPQNDYHVPSSISALTPLPKADEPVRVEEPHVVAQQRAIAESFDAPEEDTPVVEAPRRRRAKAQVVTLPKRPVAVAAGKKAAFTLRLDADRHLRLRLACAVTGSSAQQIVSGALDAYLAALPEVDTLAATARRS